jgi:deoxycytidylate deaminase
MRMYPDGTCAAHMHAEMDVLRFAEPGDDLEVMRFRKCDNQLAMAKPCKYCMKHIEAAGIKSVRYTDESGAWKKLKLRKK